MKKFGFTLPLLLTAALNGAVLEEWPLASQRYTELGDVKILDAKELAASPEERADFSAISDIAYDSRNGLLYGVSDNGLLYVMRAKIGKKRIKALEIVRLEELKGKNGKPLKGKKMRDAEGLDILDKGLIVSFERRPRIALFDTYGRMIRKVELPKPLRKRSNYRGKNKMLEAVVFHPDFGILSAPEIALKKEDRKKHTIYGKNIRFEMAANGSLTAMALTKKGNILILERDFDPLFRDRVTTLSLLNPERGSVKRLAELRSEDGWNLDNFEGLTHVEANRFLMISDDNDNPLQSVVLVLLEIRE